MLVTVFVAVLLAISPARADRFCPCFTSEMIDAALVSLDIREFESSDNGTMKGCTDHKNKSSGSNSFTTTLEVEDDFGGGIEVEVESQKRKGETRLSDCYFQVQARGYSHQFSSRNFPDKHRHVAKACRKEIRKSLAWRRYCPNHKRVTFE